MKNIIKYLSSFVLIIAGLIVLVEYNQWSYKTENGQNDDQILQDPDTTISVAVDLQFFDDRMIRLTKKAENKRILPLVVLESKTCPPCNDNIVEYSELFKKTIFFLNQHWFLLMKRRRS